MHKILAINPGATSTKIAVFNNYQPVFLKNISHHKTLLNKFSSIAGQYEFRKLSILDEIEKTEINLSDIQVVMARGGLLKPIASGVYHVNSMMKDELLSAANGEHASNLGALIADEIARGLNGVNAFIADPVVVDELQDVARISGHPAFVRKSVFHALNHKATARMYAKIVNKKYEELNLVVAHLGSGISIAAHQKGKVIDVNQALDGEGPFSPERCGTLPAGDLVRYCIQNQLNEKDVFKLLSSEGGLISYLKTNNAYEVEIRASEGDEYARHIQDAMSYQIAKNIGAMAAVLKGNVDAIILTGGVSNNTMLVEYIKDMVSFIGRVVIYPGEDEMHALAMNGILVLKGEIVPKEYCSDNFVMPLPSSLGPGAR